MRINKIILNKSLFLTLETGVEIEIEEKDFDLLRKALNTELNSFSITREIKSKCSGGCGPTDWKPQKNNVENT